MSRCDCLKDHSGDDCSVELPKADLLQRCQEHMYHDIKECMAELQPCLNACSYRGKCRAGMCHCKPGHYGADCSVSIGADGKPALLAGQGYQTRHKRPSIYVYELPPTYSTW